MKEKNMNRNLKILAATAASFAATSAHAALDISEATTAIGEAKTAVLAIAALVFGVMVAAKVWKWARKGL